MARGRPPRGKVGLRAPRVAVAWAGRSPHAWYPDPDPLREVTAAGTAQLRAVREAELALEPDVNESLREIGTMRRIGLRGSARRVLGAVARLNVELRYHGSLEGAAKAAAGSLPPEDPGRPGRMVGAQLGLVLGAGRGAAAAARLVATRTRAFNAVLAEFANVADEYRRDGAAAELHQGVVEKKFARRDRRKHWFTGMSVDPLLAMHRDNEVLMRIRRRAILSSVYTVEYYVFRVRLHTDDEHIDSPKFARNADECEVRMPDGSLVNPDGIMAVARDDMMNAHAQRHLAFLKGLGKHVEIEKGL